MTDIQIYKHLCVCLPESQTSAYEIMRLHNQLELKLLFCRFLIFYVFAFLLNKDVVGVGHL